MNKGQFEIMGIAILVAIITFGILIFFMLGQNQKDENIVKQYSNTEFAQGYIEVLLKTTVEDCNDHTLNELMRDCVNSQAIRCGSEQFTSCDKSRGVAESTLQRSLEKYGKKYQFRAAKTSGSTEQNIFTIESPNYQCAEKERPGRQPLPNNVLLTLEICG